MSDHIVDAWANLRRDVLGVSDATVALFVKRWRSYAERYDARADVYAASGRPEQARLAKGVAAEWRQDADELARQLQGPDTAPPSAIEALEHLDHNLDDLRSDDEEAEPEGDDDA